MSGAVRVLHVLPDLAMGGGQMIVLNLVSTPVEGVEHTVVALGPGPMGELFDRAGIAVEVLDTNGPVGWMRTVARVTARVRRERWDVVHTNNTPLDRTVGFAVAALARRPTVNTLMAVATSHAPRQPGEPLAAFARRRAGNLANRVLARGGTDRITALSNTVRRAHAAALRVPPARIEVVYPGVPDTAFATPDAASLSVLRDALGLAHADPILITIGRLEPNKGQLDLVGVLGSVVERFPAAQLLLVGDGPDREQLERAFAAAGLSDHAHVLGRRSDVGELLALSNILVSTARLEGFGMAALEALAAGCPVAGYLNDHVALDEFVEHGRTGCLVPVDAAALADAVVALAGDRDARPVIADRCRETAQRYRSSRSAAQMAGIYRELALGEPPAERDGTTGR